MLSKKNRAGVRELENVFKSGKFLNTPNLTFKFVINSSFSLPRVSFVVPKTVAKKATERNFLRRLGYKALEDHITKFPPGVLGVFVFKKYQEDISVIRTEIQSILHKIPWRLHQ